MRLAIIRQRYTPQGGAEHFLEGALEALLERNVAITLYTREWPQTKLQLIEPHIINPMHVGALWRDWGFARAVTKHIVASKANLVQSHDRVRHVRRLSPRRRPPRHVARGAAARRVGPAAHAGGDEPLAPLHARHGTQALREPMAAHRPVPSKMVRDDIKARFGLPDERLPVLYNAVDSNLFSPALSRASRAHARQVQDRSGRAAFSSWSGRAIAARACRPRSRRSRSSPPPAHLLIVGDDRRHGAYKRLAARAWRARPRDLRRIPERRRAVLRRGDAFVLPALYDSFPDAAMEALASGLPVVTSTQSGAAELVTEHDAGFVCDSRDVSALAAHMKTLQDADVRARLGANARQAVLPLSPAAMTLKLVLIYKELLEASVAHKLAARSAASRAPPTTTEAQAVARRGRPRLRDAAARARRRSFGARTAETLSERLVRLAIVRQRYTPYGGAERFVERALDALAARGVELTLVTRRWPSDGDRARHAARRRPAVSRPHDARRGIRARRVRGACRLPGARWCNRTSASRAATSIAPATACTRCGSRSACAMRRRGSALALAASPYHRYMLAAERRLYASPRLRR